MDPNANTRRDFLRVLGLGAVTLPSRCAMIVGLDAISRDRTLAAPRISTKSRSPTDIAGPRWSLELGGPVHHRVRSCQQRGRLASEVTDNLMTLPVSA